MTFFWTSFAILLVLIDGFSLPWWYYIIAVLFPIIDNGANVINERKRSKSGS